MNFGRAIEEMKNGSKVCRAGWNGKGMYIAIQKGSVITEDQARGGVAKKIVEDNNKPLNEGENWKDGFGPGSTITIADHIDMKAADGTVVVGWLASQTDMLTEDWEISR